jgi:hypothetical protein
MTLDPVAHALLEFRQDCPLCRAARHAGPLPRSDMVPPRARAAVVAAVVTGSTVLPASALAHGGGPSTGAVQEVADDESGVATEATTTAVETEYNLPAPPAAPDMPPLPGGGSVVPPGHGGTPPGHAEDPVAPPSSEGSEGSESSPTVTAPAGGSPEGNEPDPEQVPPSAEDVPDVPDAGNPVGGGHGAPAGGGGGAPSVPVGGGSPAAPAPPQVDVPPTAPSVDQGGDATAAPAAPSAGGDSRDASASLPGNQYFADASQGGKGDKSGGGAADSSGGASNSGGQASGEASAVTVQSGDSLWLVAEQQLGPDASVADVAAYVNELWDLNADAIGTGDPNLIMPGQTLQLPG